MQIWAVDVSAYSLWKCDDKGEDVIQFCLKDNHDEQTKVKRYLREIDQVRCLAGKILVRLAILAKRPDLSLEDLHFKMTKEGKPYVSSPLLDFDFNITHDGDWVAIAFDGTMQNTSTSTSSRIGVDVMEIHLPHYEKSVQDFVDTIDVTLTPHERDWILEESKVDLFLTSRRPSADFDRASYNQLKKLYTLWTYKEAYTKAKGIGLGYDFQNIEITKCGDNVSLTVEEQGISELDIIEIVLPAGQGQNRKVGAGTGMDSLLVALKLNSQADSRGFLTKSAQQAVEKGLLRLFSMDELVTLLYNSISKKHNSNGIK